MKVTSDQEVDSLNLKTAAGLRTFVRLLAGQDQLATSQSSETRLSRYAEEVNSVGLEFRHINNLLLVLGQNKIEEDFFGIFFGAGPGEGLSEVQLKSGLSNFRLWALLCYGNFRRAFQDWRRMTRDQIVACWAPFDTTRDELQPRLRSVGKSAAINQIEPDNTYANGEISSQTVLTEFRTALTLADAFDIPVDVSRANELARSAELMMAGDQLRPLELTVGQREAISTNWKKQRAEQVVADLLKTLDLVDATRKTARANTDDYLIASKIDVYVATSMRENWEFSETATFLVDIFDHDHEVLKYLDYFDPTQSLLGSVDKGLLEGLMLNRVRATLYMTQESDTLGKDSELASTLAQGKPVIAYVPRIVNTDRSDWKLNPAEEEEISRWVERFRKRPIDFFRKRIFSLLASGIFYDPKFQNVCRENGIGDVSDLIKKFIEALETFDPLFTTVPDDHTRFKEMHKWFPEFVRMFVFAEARNFDKRATVLQRLHPLGLQIQMTTGTANGVLVVRTSAKCKQLLEAMLMNEVEFRIVEESWGTALIESISDSRFRVVTKNAVLTAAFWNFFAPARTLRPGASRATDS